VIPFTHRRARALGALALASVAVVAAPPAACQATSIRDRSLHTTLKRADGLMTSNMAAGDRFAAYVSTPGTTLRIIDTTIHRRTSLAVPPICNQLSGRAISGENLLVSCSSGTSAPYSLLVNARTKATQVVDAPSPNPNGYGYTEIGKVWMEADDFCGAGTCSVYRRLGTNRTRVFPGPIVVRDLDSPGLSPLHLCAPFTSTPLDGRYGQNASWNGRVLLGTTKSIQIGACGTGTKRTVTPSGYRLGAGSSTLFGGWTAWLAKPCSRTPVAVAYNVHRNTRYSWPALGRVKKSAACLSGITATRYGTVVTTLDHNVSDGSIPQPFETVWFAPFPAIPPKR
jgi:hypothetical protein